MDELLMPLMMMLLLKALAIVVTRSYKGIVKYTSIQDATRIFIAMTISTFAFVIIRRYMQSQHDCTHRGQKVHHHHGLPYMLGGANKFADWI